MVSDLMSFMDNVLPFAARVAPLESSGRWMVATELGRSEALSEESFHPDDGESMRAEWKIPRSLGGPLPWGVWCEFNQWSVAEPPDPINMGQSAAAR
jgi:hypothetical protein